MSVHNEYELHFFRDDLNFVLERYVWQSNFNLSAFDESLTGIECVVTLSGSAEACEPPSLQVRGYEAYIEASQSESLRKTFGSHDSDYE